MKSLQERRADRERRNQLARREYSPAPQELKPQDKVDYNELTVPELKALVNERGLDSDGTKKADYIAVLEVADGVQSEPTAAVEQPSGGIPPVQPWGNTQ
ncbi:MAG: SAP domain-containing protein [Acholeplasmataceae bacterium]|nr:SAP domain-containing protein [Acholeplasmataceae bacterium]